MAKNVKLYALSTCGWCKKTHFFLEDHNIQHELIPVDLLEEKEKEQAREHLSRFNPKKSYPTVVIDDSSAVVGFQEEQLRTLLGLPPSDTPEMLLERTQKEAEASGYFLNPERGLVLTLMEGLLKNLERYEYAACPCMESYGSKDLDLDIICPCDYRDQDLAEYGACYCALYVSEQIASGKAKAGSIPLRRPGKEEREEQMRPAQSSSLSNAAPTRPSESSASVNSPINTPLPIWRCKVCGYLCAKEDPPLKCPICGAEKDWFELFIQGKK